MNLQKIDIFKFSVVSLILIIIAISGVLVCKHATVKDDENRDWDQEVKNALLLDNMINGPGASHISRPGIISAYSANVIEKIKDEKPDIYVQSICSEGFKWLIVSRKVGENVAIAIEQIRGKDGLPIACEEEK